MAKEEKTIYVYDHFTGNAPVLLGKLNVGIIKAERHIRLNIIKIGWQKISCS